MKLYLADISNDIIICTKDYLIDLLEKSDDVVSAKRMDNLAEIQINIRVKRFMVYKRSSHLKLLRFFKVYLI